jgi:hypothetical protein
MTSLLDILWHKPILNALLNPYFDLKTILRLSATCRKLYNEWIPLLEQVYPIESVLNNVYWHRDIPNITTLRKVVAGSYHHCLYKPGLFKCVRCGVIEYQARLINFEISKHSICYVCFVQQQDATYFRYRHCMFYIQCVRNNTKLSERMFNKWFSENSISLFQHSGNDYAKIDYWVVKRDKVVEKYGGKRQRKKRK